MNVISDTEEKSMFMKLYQIVRPKLQKIFKRNDASCSDDFCSKYGYEHLVPRDDVDPDGTYCELLNWAISNEKYSILRFLGLMVVAKAAS
jgi:hypothetical protein